MIPKKPAPDLIRGVKRFPAFAKPATAGEARSEKIMLKLKEDERQFFVACWIACHTR
jgi:hypothetical protein